MLNMIYPILIIVIANTIYNIVTKSMPENVNSYAALSITYFVAMVVSILMFFITDEQKNLLFELTKANWTSFLLGFAIVGLETGFILAFRAGWKISVANVVANITLAIILIFVGVILYKESISIKQIAGIVCCAFGLALIMN